MCRWGNRRGPRVGDGSYLGSKTDTLAAQAVVIASRTNELSGDATGVKDHLLLLGRQIAEVRLSRGASQRPKLVTQAPVVLSRTIELSGDVTGASDHRLFLGRQITEIRLSRGVSQRPKLVTQAAVVLGPTTELPGATGVSDHRLLLGRKLAKVRGASSGAQYRRGDQRESEGTNRGQHGRAQVYRHWLR